MTKFDYDDLDCLKPFRELVTQMNYEGHYQGSKGINIVIKRCEAIIKKRKRISSKNMSFRDRLRLCFKIIMQGI